MHPTALSNAKRFFDTYLTPASKPTIVEIGSQDVNGSLRDVCPTDVNYIGLDFVQAKGVDIVLDDPYKLPFEDGTVDAIVSSSCFEHSEMFWLVFSEVMRVLKPTGLFYLNAPSNGAFHRYPVDCWRFYPDSGRALVTWGRHCGYRPAMLESYFSHQYQDIWTDFVCVFVKDEAEVERFPNRMLDTHPSFENGLKYGSDEVIHFHMMPEDIRRQDQLTADLEVANDRVAMSVSDAMAMREQAAALQQSVMRLQADVAELRREMASLRQVGAATQQQLDAARQRVHELESSTSWRITAPLRALRRLLT